LARANHGLGFRIEGFVELHSDGGNRGKDGREGDEKCKKVEEGPSAKRPGPRIEQSACRDVFITEKQRRLRYLDGQTNFRIPPGRRFAIRSALRLVGYQESAHPGPAIVFDP